MVTSSPNWPNTVLVMELRPLRVRDATANNLAEAIDFSRRNASAPQFAVPPGPVFTPCLPDPGGIDESEVLAEFARLIGFAVL